MGEFGDYTLQELEDALRYSRTRGALDRARTIEREISSRKQTTAAPVNRALVLGPLVLAVGLIEILGGIHGGVSAGIGIGRFLASDLPNPNRALTATIGIMFVLLFFLSTAAGILLLSGRPSGIKLSFVVQGFQRAYFKVWSIEYIFVITGALLVNLINPTVGFFTRVGNHFTLTIGKGDYAFQFGINIAALAAMGVLAAAHERRSQLARRNSQRA